MTRMKMLISKQTSVVQGSHLKTHDAVCKQHDTLESVRCGDDDVRDKGDHRFGR